MAGFFFFAMITFLRSHAGLVAITALALLWVGWLAFLNLTRDRADRRDDSEQP